MNIMKFLRTPILRNIWECLLLYQSKLLMFHYYIAACFTALKRQSICNAIFSFIFFLFLFFVKLKPLCDKKTTREKIIRSFFCVFMIDSFQFWRCSTKGASLQKEPHRATKITSRVGVSGTQSLPF